MGFNTKVFRLPRPTLNQFPRVLLMPSNRHADTPFPLKKPLFGFKGYLPQVVAAYDFTS
jgi:hypothetical protein